MRKWEAASWQAGRSQAEVIGRVGRCLADRVRDLTRAGDRVLVLAGKGHNGDDARAALPHLAGREVLLIEVADPRLAAAELAASLVPHPAWIVDGLFGIGLNRPQDDGRIALIASINASGVRILSVDVPSGLDAESGKPLGAAVRAELTLTVGAPKRGLLQPSAWDFTGRLEVEPDIGLAPCAEDGDLLWSLPADFDAFPPRRPVAGHKGDFGHLVILAGSKGYHGAAVLAARAAQRARPGLITLGTLPEVYIPVAAQLQGVMVDEWPAALRKLERATALLAGPGLAADQVPAELKAAVRELWQSAPVPVVVDASALDWLPAGGVATLAPRVITPHQGEAARLLGRSAAQVQANRPGSVRELSARHGGCWVVLKGFQTLVGRREGPVFVNGSGDSALAQGGTGDVLAGYLAGLLARPLDASAVGKAVRYAVWRHGAAADELARGGHLWTADELASAPGWGQA
jgi:NAD(P)H-hydrate epimerase